VWSCVPREHRTRSSSRVARSGREPAARETALSVPRAWFEAGIFCFWIFLWAQIFLVFLATRGERSTFCLATLQRRETQRIPPSLPFLYRTRRTWKPNAQRKRLYSEILDRMAGGCTTRIQSTHTQLEGSRFQPLRLPTYEVRNQFQSLPFSKCNLHRYRMVQLNVTTHALRCIDKMKGKGCGWSHFATTLYYSQSSKRGSTDDSQYGGPCM
jgi:ribosomal protein L28